MALWKRKKDKSTEAPGTGDSAVQDEPNQDEPIQDDSSSDQPPGDGPVAVAEPDPDPQPEARGGLFGRFRKAVRKTVDVLNTDVRDLFREEGELVDDEFLKKLFALMVKTDMGAGPAGSIRDAVGKKYRARKMTIHQLAEAASEVIVEIMEQESSDLLMATSGPTVIMVVGVNGSGKTTSIAKLTHLFREQGKSVVLGAGDTFRAAAVEQLTIWADRLGAEIVTGKQGGDPATVAYRAADKAKETNADVCIVDTAGRLQTQKNLMDQLTKIRNVIKKVIPDAPHEVLLVLDATAGQNAISQARGFSDAADCTGIVLAKLDGTAKGGVAIPIRQEFGLPVKFIGLGETPDAIAQFDVEQFVHALFDLDGKS